MQVDESPADGYRDLADAVLCWLPRAEAPEITPLFLDDDFATRRRVVRAHGDGALLGVGLRAHLAFHPPERETVMVVVDPQHRGTGTGTLLHSRLLADLDPGVTSLRATTYDDDERSGDIAQHWGYARLQRSMTARVEVSAAAPPELPPDVSTHTHRDLELPDAGAVETMLLVSQTNPEVAHSGAMTLANLRGAVAADETMLLVLARVAGVPAAISFGMANGPVAYVSYTGVDPAYRGRGLARLTKQALHVAAREAGALACFTDNEEHNTGIRRVNADLGYEVVAGVWRHERSVT